MAVQISDAQQSAQLFGAVAVEALCGLHEQPSGTKQGVLLAATVSEQLVLRSAPALVDLVDCVLGDVEGVDPDPCLRQVEFDGPAVGAGEVQGARFNVAAPQVRAPEQLANWSLGGSAFDHVEEPPPAHVNDGRRELTTVDRSATHEDGFIEAKGADAPEFDSIEREQPPADAHERVVDGVPVTTQVSDHPRHGATEPSDLEGHPPSRSLQHRLAW